MQPLRTGPKPPEPREPVEILLQCHDRIRHFSTVALRLARSPHASPRLITDSASALRRYFGTALPMHEEDEEERVTPRLLESPGGRRLEHELARMAGDHRAIDVVVAELDVIWERVMARPAALVEFGEAMHTHARSLTSMFEAHLQLEEETIFPALAALPDATRRLIATEIRQRRSSGMISIPPRRAPT